MDPGVVITGAVVAFFLGLLCDDEGPWMAGAFILLILWMAGS